MAARAIWKGVIKAGTVSVPVKLYSAVTDRTVHFRLLHKTDKQPVKQKLVSADSGEPIEYAEVRKAFPIARGRMVVLEDEERKTAISCSSPCVTPTRSSTRARCSRRRGVLYRRKSSKWRSNC